MATLVPLPGSPINLSQANGATVQNFLLHHTVLPTMVSMNLQTLPRKESGMLSMLQEYLPVLKLQKKVSVHLI